ncbi:Predicted dehydrogenase [Paenibacillaceae bacterium GAS479]|nr:Predicted dehydrogenase [Paenibacillaceae bacterium GAS479]
MGDKDIRWGIIGPGGISDSFANDLKHVPGASLMAVAGRNADKTKAFADKHGIPRSYGSATELAADQDVDIVYIGTIHPAHKQNMLDCIAGGKHVLCEKPFTMDAEEAREVAAAAAAKGVFIMEAMWTRFLPPIRKVRQWLDEGLIGEVKLLKAEFGFDFGWNPEHRLLNKELGGGTLLDAGIYPVSFASFVFGEQPTRIQSTVNIGKTGVDEQFSLLFEYEGGRTASLHGAIQLFMENEAWIYGTKGKIRVPGFLWSNRAELHVQDQEPVIVTDEREFHGYVYEAMECMTAIREGRMISDTMPVGETVDIMATLDAIRAQWGLKYE